MNTTASWPHNTHPVAFFKHRNKLWCKDEETQEAYSLITCKKSRKKSGPCASPRVGGGGEDLKGPDLKIPNKERNKEAAELTLGRGIAKSTYNYS